MEEWSLSGCEIEDIEIPIEDFDDILIGGNFFICCFDMDNFLMTNLASGKITRYQKSLLENLVKEHIVENLEMFYPDEEEPLNRNNFLVSGTEFLKMNTGVNSIEVTAKMEFGPSLVLRDEIDHVRLGNLFNVSYVD